MGISITSKFQKQVMRIGLAVAFPSFLVAPNAAATQTHMMEGWLPSITQNNLQNQVLWGPYQEADKSSKTPRPTAAPSPLALAALRFTPDAALRKTIVSEFASSMKVSGTPTPLGRFLTDGEALRGSHQRMIAAGLSPTNVADSMAFFIASHWSLARGGAAPPPRAVLQAFSKQVTRMLADQPETSAMTNVAKQRRADSGMLLTAITLRVSEEARGDPEETANVATSASRMIKGMGFDPDKFDLTPQGLVLVK